MCGFLVFDFWVFWGFLVGWFLSNANFFQILNCRYYCLGPIALGLGRHTGVLDTVLFNVDSVFKIFQLCKDFHRISITGEISFSFYFHCPLLLS